MLYCWYLKSLDAAGTGTVLQSKVLEIFVDAVDPGIYSGRTISGNKILTVVIQTFRRSVGCDKAELTDCPQI